MYSDIAICTRFFGNSPENISLIAGFVEVALTCVPPENILIAINGEKDKSNAIGWLEQSHPGVVAFEVHPWGKFVIPLNSLLLKAQEKGMKHVLFASTEFPPQKTHISYLLRHMDEKTLVVGARLAEHSFSSEQQPVQARGLTVPWNTFAIWNLAIIGDLGFPLVGDSPTDPPNAGVEEVSAIAVAQRLHGEDKARAVVVHIPEFYKEWNMEGWDEGRIVAHQKKIQSKDLRPETQISRLGISHGVVHHVA